MMKAVLYSKLLSMRVCKSFYQLTSLEILYNVNNSYVHKFSFSLFLRVVFFGRILSENLMIEFLNDFSFASYTERLDL